MRYLSTLSIVIALMGIVLLSACKNESDTARDNAVQNVTPAPADGTTAAPAVTPPAPTQEPAQNAAGIWHYTCPKGCEGGGGAATACAKCGTTLVHNQGYHANTEPSLSVGGNNQTAPVATPPTQEPAQNAKGVWHYTCSKGCAGGAGSAIACAKCGATLAHNQAYHQ